MLIRLLLLALVLSGILAARSFTDVTGKTIEAELVSLADDKVTISKAGKLFTLPLANFSTADQGMIKALAPTQAIPIATIAKIQLAGNELRKNGELNLIEAPLTEETLKKTRANKDITGIKIAILLPLDFDPAVPHKVLWVSSPINSEADRTSGNCPAVSNYSSTALAEGWVVIAVDCNLGNPRREDNQAANFDLPIQHQAVTMLSAEWPGFAKSQFACAGYSGGSKTSFYRVGQLCTAGLNVVGLFLSGCNENLTESTKNETKVHSKDLKKIKVFVSNGKTDEIATVKQGEFVAAGVKKEFGAVRTETFDGGHSISQEHLKSALAWFLETAASPGK